MLVFGGVIPFLGPGALFVTQNSKVGKVSNPTLGDKVGSRIESPNRRHIFSGRRIFPGSLWRAEKEFGVADARTGEESPQTVTLDHEDISLFSLSHAHHASLRV